MLTAARTLVPFLRPYRGRMLIVLVSILVVAGAGLLAPWLIRALVQSLTLAGSDPAAALTSVTQIALVLLVLYILRSAGQYINFHLSHVVAFDLCHDLQVAVYRQLQRFSPAYFAERQTGEIVSRVVKDTEDIEPVIADVVYDFVVSVLLAVGIIVILLSLSPTLTLLTFLPMPFAIAAVLRLNRPIIRAFEDEAERSGEISALVQDNVAGIKEIQVFNREHHELARVRTLSHRYTRQQIYARKLTALLYPIIEGATGLSVVLVVAFGGAAVARGEGSIEDLVAFVLYITVFYQPLWMLVNVSEAFQRGIASLKRIGEVLALQPEVDDPPNGVEVERAKGEITLERVGFAYRTGLPVLHDIDLRVPAGQTLALVGPTGAGKSTIISLVARFYDPQAGRVLIDGIDVREWKLGALRRNISVVLQDVFLFYGTVRENIRFGKPDAENDEVIAAAQVANAHDFIMALPHGYDTLIGERGVKLSGGQKQRISIARAVLKDAPILILDEATSAVDSETEAQIQQAMERLRHGRTCIVIAHRLSTVRSADQIAVLDGGRVVELGSHREILANEGLYARLVERQTASS
jgi:ABC-type multidrug transport system fused ATPase/permease subunit